jgi:hypothetical protein
MREFFSATQELYLSGQFGLIEWQKWRTSSPYFVSSLIYSIRSSGYTAPEMHHQQANAIQTTRAGAWPVWLIWYAPRV